jgi:hypothetical protein
MEDPDFTLTAPTLHKIYYPDGDEGFRIVGGLPQRFHLGIIAIKLSNMEVTWVDHNQHDGTEEEIKKRRLTGDEVRGLIRHYIPDFGDIAPVWTRWE